MKKFSELKTMNNQKSVCKQSIISPSCSRTLQNTGEFNLFLLASSNGTSKLSKNHLFETYFSEPTHDGDPVSNYLPIQDDRINFLDVTNDGLIVGINPNQEANQLWSGIERKVQQMNVDTQNRTREEL